MEKDVFEGPITYHDPCNIGRRGGIIGAPRNILKSLTALRQIKDIFIVLCGRKSAYIETKNAEFISRFSEYYSEYAIVEDLTKVENDDFLKIEFSDYLFWIANYNFYREKMEEDWLFWQFTEKATVSGIKGNVDVNIFNGDLQQLQFITKE